MKKKGGTLRYSGDEIDAMLAHGESRTDWNAVTSMTEEQLEASIAVDPDDTHEPVDWTRTVTGLPAGKRDVHLRIDADVLDWFRQTGCGYQTRINNALRAFMESRKRASR